MSASASGSDRLEVLDDSRARVDVEIHRRRVSYFMLFRLGLILAGLRGRNVSYFGTDLSGVRLVATDLDWAYGDGAPLRGAAQHLLLVICGRRLPSGLLDGAPAARFARQDADV